MNIHLQLVSAIGQMIWFDRIGLFDGLTGIATIGQYVAKLAEDRVGHFFDRQRIIIRLAGGSVRSAVNDTLLQAAAPALVARFARVSSAASS
jgi:hypothetical protein